MSDKIKVRVDLADQSNTGRPRLRKILTMHKPVHGEDIVCGDSRYKVGKVSHLIGELDADVAVNCVVTHREYEHHLLDATWKQQ